MSETQTQAHDPGANRLEDGLDALLNLLDRQIADRDGRLVGKVDDLELTEQEDGVLHVTGILTGSAALVPRFGGDHDRGALGWWRRLSPARADRDVPGWIDIDDVDALGSGVSLSRQREGLIVPEAAAGPGTRHRRLSGLLGMHIEGPEGSRLKARITDVRLQPDAARKGSHPRVVSLLTGRVRPGLLLGYDRAQVNGPWLLARTLAWVNRFTRELPWDDIDRIDWDDKVVHARTEPRPLRDLHAE